MQAAPPPVGGAAVVGRSPKAANGFSSIVIFERQGDGQPAAQTAVPVMDQVQQTFLPEILFVRTGQPTEFRNNDDVLHNVRVREDATKKPAFNVAIPTGGSYLFTFERDGFYDVGCDIHPGMSAQIVSTTSPYIAMADADGNFTMANVPPGEYKAIVYAGPQHFERMVAVPSQAGPLDLSTP